ncbi:DapH/DapD/GlmU-related protein [Sphingobacterium sp. JUb56]|uniref:acyltransferase n=1 Tax=Sphingobacterium sp. JUb56 TaxID=2587145 RepID=UPI00160CA525|nr:acyltransferase [Sphingobacterium sp. JUb56]MBB2951162.1 acetyltransferase-like isoleucine patch superfamily enzyme [Sphingobacterium sp. JUb56]
MNNHLNSLVSIIYTDGNNIQTLSEKQLREFVDGNLQITGKYSLQISSSSIVKILKGKFVFNASWIINDPFPSLLSVSKNAKLIVHDTFYIYSGSKVYINENAKLELGSGYINNNLNLSCFESILIGTNVAIAENVTIRDSDNHTISSQNKPRTMPITIGDNVWIGMNVTILKGVTIGNGAVIAAGAVVTKSIPSNCLAAGVPAKVIKENVTWN